MAKKLRALRAKCAPDNHKGLVISGAPSPVYDYIDGERATEASSTQVAYALFQSDERIGRVKVPVSFNMNKTMGLIVFEDEFVNDDNETVKYYQLVDTFNDVGDINSAAEAGTKLVELGF